MDQMKLKKYSACLRELTHSNCSVFLLVKDRKVCFIAFTYGASRRFYFVSGISDKGRYIIAELKYDLYNPFSPELIGVERLDGFGRKELERFYHLEQRQLQDALASPTRKQIAVYDLIACDEIYQAVCALWVHSMGYQVLPVSLTHRRPDLEDDF